MAGPVKVRRFPVSQPRDPHTFGSWSARVFGTQTLGERRTGVARRRRSDQSGAGALRRRPSGRVRLRPVLQLPLLPRVSRRARRAGQGDSRADGGTRRSARPRHLPAAAAGRARVHVQLARGAHAAAGGRRHRRGARRGGRRGLRSAGRRQRCPLPPAHGHPGAHRDLHRPHRREQGLRRALRFLEALCRDYARRPDARAHRHTGAADSPAPADQAPRLRQRRREVRRAGRGRVPDHAVVLREPLDGGTRGVGPRQAGARQREVRRAARTGRAQQRRACTTRTTESSPRPCACSMARRTSPPRSDRTAAAISARHYAWPVIERKYLDMFERLSKQDAGEMARRPAPELPGWWGRRQKTLPPAREVLQGLPSGPALGREPHDPRPRDPRDASESPATAVRTPDADSRDTRDTQRQQRRPAAAPGRSGSAVGAVRGSADPPRGGRSAATTAASAAAMAAAMAAIAGRSGPPRPAPGVGARQPATPRPSGGAAPPSGEPQAPRGQRGRQRRGRRPGGRPARKGEA